MLTWQIIYFKEAQEKLQKKTVVFQKNWVPFIHVPAEHSQVTIFPLNLAHKLVLPLKWPQNPFINYRNQSDAHVTENSVWGTPGKTAEQTAVCQKLPSSHWNLSRGFPRPHLPTDAGTWTASLCAPLSLVAVGTKAKTNTCVRAANTITGTLLPDPETH